MYLAAVRFTAHARDYAAGDPPGTSSGPNQISPGDTLTSSDRSQRRRRRLASFVPRTIPRIGRGRG